MNNRTYTSKEEPPQRKNQPLKIWLPALLLLILAIFLIFSENNSVSTKNPKIPTAEPGTQEAFELLLYTQLPVLIGEVGHDNWSLDEVQFNHNNTQALLWMAVSEMDGSEVLAGEPEIVLALWDFDDGKWHLHLVNDEDFSTVFLNSDFKDSEIASRFFPDADPKPGPTEVVYGGYKLPWQAGLSKRITWSVAHSSCIPKYYCTYAFDFADGTMFEISAAKSGYVYHWRDTCWNGDSGCTNSITLEDRSTNPWTYQIYLHLAKNSIPPELKQEGAFVSQGTMIGKADDTGVSTGHHLHFMVVEQPTLDSCKNYCFGRSVDITFRDVRINWDAATQGGRPRLESEASWYGGQGQRYYVSENYINEETHYNFYFPLLFK